MMMRIWRYVKHALPLKSLIILVVLVFVVLLPLVCYNLEHSSYFIQGDLNHAAYLKRLANNKRIAAARSYFNQKYNKEKLPFNYHRMTSDITSKAYYPKIAFIILASNRDTHKVDAYEPKYLTQTLHALLLAISRDVAMFGKRWSNISISMCNIDTIPDKFYELRLLTKYFDVIELKDIKIKPSNITCKSNFDMNLCLSVASKKYADVDRFVIIEDDLLANEDLFKGLVNVFSSLQKRFKSDVNKMLGYVQLFYPKHQVRFLYNDSSSLLELISISSLLVLLLYALYFRLYMRSIFMIYNILLIIVLLVICGIVAIVIGRPHWQSIIHKLIGSYSLVEPIFKSVAAVLFSRQYLNDLAQFDTANMHWQNECKLHTMETVAIQNHRRILSVNYNLFKHIGLYSSFKKTIINPYHVE